MRKLNNYELTLKNKYHDMLKDNRKSPAEICYYIESKYNVVDVSNDDSVILKYKAIFIENCLNSICNAEGLLKKEDLKLVSYIVKRDEKSKTHYEKFDKQNAFSEIYIIVDMTTGDMNSNCDEINTDLFFQRGISKLDIENNSEDLSLYLNILEEIMTKK